MPRRISPEKLIELIGTDGCPIVVDVRRAQVFGASPTRIAGSVWRDPTNAHEWYPQMPPGRALVVYCAHGHNVSELVAARLDRAGAQVALLSGGIDAFAEAGGLLVRTNAPGVDVTLPGGSVWVTRERPKIDRIACPWLIRRLIDPFAVFLFVAAKWVRDVADELGAVPFDVEGVLYSHRGATCSFDTLLAEFGVADASLLHLARIVRGADTAQLDLEPQSAGLLALSLGLSAIEKDDQAQLEKGMLLYDALYGWCRHAVGERHNWPAGAAPT